jgi:outer membrane protein assembly factor BamB
MRRKSWLILLALGVSAAVVYLIVQAVTPATRFIYGLAPVSREEAVLLTRRNEDHATYFWAELVASDGTHRWSSELTPFETHDALGYSGVAATAELVLLLGARDASTVVMALARATGERVWETTVAAGTGPDRIGPTLVVDPPRLLVLHERVAGERRDETISALSLADGKTLWQLAPPAYPGGVRIDAELLGPGRLLMTSPAGVVELATTDGSARRTLPVNWLRCATPRGIVTTDGLEVLLVPRPQAGEEVTDLRLGIGADERVALQGPCGERDGDLVLGPASGKGVGIGLARLDPVSGAARWQLDLGKWISENAESADGRLPRFLPLYVFGSETEGGPILTQVVVVDLDRGTIVSRNPVEGNMQVFFTAERAYVLARSGGALHAIDPASGALGRVTRLARIDSDDVRAEDFRFGPLWMSGMSWGGPADLSWMVFDLERGEPLRLNGKVGASEVAGGGWSPR